MKKWLVSLSGLFLGLILMAAVWFFVSPRKNDKLGTEGQAYVDLVVPAIASSWDAVKFSRLLSPEVVKEIPADKIRPLFASFTKRLGSMKEYYGSRENTPLVARIGQGGPITQTYMAKGLCEKAPVFIEVQIIKNNSEWQILSFDVNSTALLPNP